MSNTIDASQVPSSYPARSRHNVPNYRQELIDRFWVYQRQAFPDLEDYFDPEYDQTRSPPVFQVQQAGKNVLVSPAATEDESSRLLALVPSYERHKWFRSMNSSQALAQSVLGNLAVYDFLGILADLLDDCGEPLLGSAKPTRDTFVMEHKIRHLGERRSTSVDAFVSGDYQVAIECKFTEAEFGSRSQPSPLSTTKAKYWTYIPELFHWESDAAHSLFLLNKHYQLVRNVLAVCVRSGGAVSAESGHVLVIYDARNPAFQAGGQALKAYTETRLALRVPKLLRKCSWQRLVGHLRDHAILPWLTEALSLKYGL